MRDRSKMNLQMCNIPCGSKTWKRANNGKTIHSLEKMTHNTKRHSRDEPLWNFIVLIMIIRFGIPATL